MQDIKAYLGCAVTVCDLTLARSHTLTPLLTPSPFRCLTCVAAHCHNQLLARAFYRQHYSRLGHGVHA
jgi:hypothetical protein